MLSPNIPSWIEQSGHLARSLIQPCQIQPLVRIAAKTRPAQILQRRGTAMLLCHHMVGLKSQLGHRLGQAAILATEARALSDLAAQSRTHDRDQ
jgi:hypothetical protein